MIGVSAQYAHYTDVVRGMTGVPIYRDRLGRRPREDPLRQRPDPLDPRALGAARPDRGADLLADRHRFGDDGLKVTYAPFEGRSRTVDLSDPRYAMPLDFWWYPPPEHKWLARALALVVLALAVGRRRLALCGVIRPPAALEHAAARRRPDEPSQKTSRSRS